METGEEQPHPYPLAGYQRKYLRSQAHSIKSIVWIGREGVGEAVMKEVDRALEDHELIKIKFNDHKAEKEVLTARIAKESGSGLAGVIGHVAIFYRPRLDPAKRTLVLPERR